MLEGKRVPEAERQSCVCWAEVFIAAVRPGRMADASAEQITAFLHRYGREQR